MRKLFLIMMTLIACALGLSAQTHTVSGTVVDAANNEPLIGATILPIGGGQGAAADIDGNFTLTVPANVKKAKVSYVGYQEQTVDLHNGMVVKLTSTATSLDNVVVVAYGTANKESLTGSVAVVGAKEIEDRPVTTVTSALEGNAPGVQVNNSVSRPGSSPTIRIRGFNSFQSTAQSPLYVVDGVVYEGDIADINPADIESMSVLKDAASCALYGNKGANGVILITTKRAKKEGKVDVTLQVRQGMYERGLPFYDVLGADQWMETSLRAWNQGRATTTGNTYDSLIASSASSFVNSQLMGTNIYDRPAEEVFNEKGELQASILPGYDDLRWWDAISRTGYRQEYNVNATGATEKFNVFASVGYLKENGYMLQTDYERFNGRVVANYQPNSYFKMGTNISASYAVSEEGLADPDQLNANSNPFLVDYYAPIQPYYQHNEDGSIIYDAEGNPLWNTTGLNKGNNTAWNMRLDRNNWTYNTINGSLYGTAIIPYGFELTVRGNIMRRKSTGLSYSNNIIGSQQGVGGVDLETESTGSHTFMQTLNWSHEYGAHHVDVLLDHENWQYDVDYTFLRKSGQLRDDNVYLSNFENNDLSGQSLAQLRTESYLGRVRYNYDQKYFGEVSIRRDGSSRFAKDHRWGTFWSVGGSWIISKEKFMQNINWLNYLKLRVAYGSVGNDVAASSYSYWPLYTTSIYDNVAYIIPAQFAANVKWESTKTLDLALEGSLFDDRFTFTVGYFDKRNADLLYRRTLPASVGTISNEGSLAYVMQNLGTMANRGWELMFGVDILRNTPVKWNFNIDASFVQNKIVRLPDGQDIVGQRLFQGKSIYEQYEYEFAGVDLNTGNALYSMEPNSPDYYQYNELGVKEYKQDMYNAQVAAAKKAGAYYEIDGKPYTTRYQYAGRKILGSAIPTVYGSFSTNLSWKGVNLGLLFTYSLGGKSYNSNYEKLMTIGNSGVSAIHKDILNAWTAKPEGLTPFTTLEDGTIVLPSDNIDPNGTPILDTQNSMYNNVSSSRFLVSNSYLTLKNLNVSYDFPKNWVNPLKLNGISLGFSVDNLFIVTAQKGFNPQYSFNGGQGAYYVPARVYSFQLNVKF